MNKCNKSINKTASKPIENINIIAQIADMKSIDYNNLLSIITIFELLIEKGIISHEEFSNKFRELDQL